MAAAEVLGVQRVEFLGYVDSGMIDTPENDLPGSFWSADVEEAAGRLAADPRGGARRRAHLLRRPSAATGTPTTSRSTESVDGPPSSPARRGCTSARSTATELIRADGATPSRPRASSCPTSPRRPRLRHARVELITCTVDVASVGAAQAGQAMRAHASQIGDDHFMLAMPDEPSPRPSARSGSSATARVPASPRPALIVTWPVDPHRLRAAGRLRRRRGPAAARAPADDRRAPGAAGHHRGPARQRRRGRRACASLGRDLASTFAEVESHVPDADGPAGPCNRPGPMPSTRSSPSAAAAAPTSARPSPSSPSRRPASRRRRGPIARRCRTCRSRRPTRAPSSRRSSA